VVSQTNNLVPADKKLYALRDVTGTVESLPLIASSIMSKKIASGAKKLVIDVKVGTGALIKNINDATKLAKLMQMIGKSHDIEVVCLITNMDIPLGKNIGNALEVEEAMNILQNKDKGNLYEVCVELASHMVKLGLGISYEMAKEKVLENIKNGKAYNKFLEFIEYQHGDINKLPKAKNKYEIRALNSGYISNIDALSLGKLSMNLGAGRESLEDTIDYGAGIVLNKTVGDSVEIDDILMTLYTDKEIDESSLQNDAFTITKEVRKDLELIYKVLN